MKNRGWVCSVCLHIWLVRSCPTRLSVLFFSIVENIRQRQAHFQNPSYWHPPAQVDLLFDAELDSEIHCWLCFDTEQKQRPRHGNAGGVQGPEVTAGTPAENGWEQGHQWRILLLGFPALPQKVLRVVETPLQKSRRRKYSRILANLHKCTEPTDTVTWTWHLWYITDLERGHL